ncbi:Hypp665 [Branchiostoma lanceolatum]|uniref:Hypp665 protein n=1 Tax=Branchiostoma lanceolatum TaxID=7740 RepID=A0A8J9VB73_BRALA|nr:Hypp665 [Branchiostoma lanceolatum]
MQEKGYSLKAFSKKDDIHLDQLKSPASSAYLRKRFTEEQIKKRQKILARREKYAKCAVRLNRKGPPMRPRDSEERTRTKNDKTWEAGIYSAERVIDQRLQNGSKEYLVKWSGSETWCCGWDKHCSKEEEEEQENSGMKERTRLKVPVQPSHRRPANRDPAYPDVNFSSNNVTCTDDSVSSDQQKTTTCRAAAVSRSTPRPQTSSSPAVDAL